MPEKNSVHTVKIEGYSSEGMGVARLGSLVVFVRGALRGETCAVKLLKVTKNAAWAKIEALIERSPERIEPGCPAFGKCGGCALRHMSYREELEFKLRRVNDALERIGGLELRAEEIAGSGRVGGYRNKAQYAVAQLGEKALTGFYRERSHDLVPLDSCALQCKASDLVITAVREWMEKNSVPAYDEASRTGLVRHVTVRTAEASGETMAIVSAADEISAKKALISGILSACPGVASIVLNINKTPGNTVLAGSFRTLWGRDHIEDSLCGLRFRLSPQSFYQINRPQAEELYSLAMNYAGLNGTQTVLDLYCGTGTITLNMAKRSKKAIGAEIVEEAVRDARENAKLNGITNAEFIRADAGEAAELLTGRGERPDVVVADPPRKGLSAAAIDAILKLMPRRMVYVSCNPATLARDLKQLDAGGLCPVKLQAVDMFPRTRHVETVVLMSRVDK